MTTTFSNLFIFFMSEIGSVSVILKKADITKETVDVIVNSNNQTLDLNTGNSYVF